jgi:hypothetical protein
MTSCGQLKALMKKNWIYAKRNCCSAICEIIFPMILIILIVFIRKAVTATTVEVDPADEQGFFIGNSTAYVKPGSTSTTWNDLLIKKPL